MVRSTTHLQNLTFRGQLLHFLYHQCVATAALVQLFSAQLSLSTSSNHQQLPAFGNQSSMGSSAVDSFNFFFEISYFPGQKLIGFISVSQLSLVAEAPSVNLSFFSDNSRIIVSSRNIYDLFSN